MFEKIEDVPAPIAEFYTTETRSEPTGEMQEVEYPSFDENGNPTTATRLQSVFADVDYVVQVPILERCSIERVWQVVEHHRGRRDDLVKRFLSMACNANQWQFHGEYLAWHTQLLELQALEPVRAQDEQGLFVADDPDTLDNEAWLLSQGEIDAQLAEHQANEPTKPPKIDVQQWLYNNYARLREAAYASMGDQADMRFHDLENGANTWFDHVSSVKAQYPKSAE